MQFVLDEFDAFLDRAHGPIIIVPRRGHAVAVDFMAIRLQGDELYFRSAQIDADTQLAIGRVS